MHSSIFIWDPQQVKWGLFKFLFTAIGSPSPYLDSLVGLQWETICLELLGLDEPRWKGTHWVQLVPLLVLLHWGEGEGTIGNAFVRVGVGGEVRWGLWLACKVNKNKWLEKCITNWSPLYEDPGLLIINHSLQLHMWSQWGPSLCCNQGQCLGLWPWNSLGCCLGSCWYPRAVQRCPGQCTYPSPVQCWRPWSHHVVMSKLVLREWVQEGVNCQVDQLRYQRGPDPKLPTPKPTLSRNC